MATKKPAKGSVSTATIRIECEVDENLFLTLDRLEAAIVRIKHELLEVKRLARDTGVNPKVIMSSKS